MDKGKLSTVITVVAAVLALALAAWGGYVFCTQVTIADAQLYALIPIYIILIVLGAFFDELVHEGAHFLVGAMLSMGVRLPKIRIFKSSSIEVFPKGEKAMRLRFILTASAGLFFDLLIIVLGLIALLVPSVPAFFSLGLPYAFYSFVINAVPLEYGAGKTDGLAVIEAIANKPSAQVMFAILRVQGKVNGGLLLREVPESMLLDVPQIQEDDINFIMLTQLRCEYYEAKGDDSEAYKYFLRYKDLIRYLPGEYTVGRNKRVKIEVEETADEEPGMTVAELVEAAQAPVDSENEEEQPSEEQPAESSEKLAEEQAEPAEEQKENKEE